MINSRKLPIIQRRVLKKDCAHLFSSTQISVNLKTGSLVSKALSSLIKKEIIVKNGNYNIQDIIFKKWLKKTLSI
jgi:hypothetical protein